MRVFAGHPIVSARRGQKQGDPKPSGHPFRGALCRNSHRILVPRRPCALALHRALGGGFRVDFIHTGTLQIIAVVP